MPGYVLDPAIGGSYICNNGVWSTKPQCLSKSYILHTHIFYMPIILFKVTGRCLFSTLQNFISSSISIQTTGQSLLMADSQNTSIVFNGSYIVLACVNGYTNTGASLNVTCLANSSWSQFPNCVSNPGSGSMTTTTTPTGSGSMATTTIATGNGSPCMIDGATTFTIANGNYLSSSLAFASATSATGNPTKCSFIIHI
jgi:hypothetical protein